jgi:hypothetical protein
MPGHLDFKNLDRKYNLTILDFYLDRANGFPVIQSYKLSDEQDEKALPNRRRKDGCI